MGLSTTYTKTETDFLIQQLEKKTASGYKGDLSKTDVAPTQIGFYGLTETGVYSNLGGIDAQAGKLNFASFDGTTWSLVSIDVNANEISKVFNEQDNDNACSQKAIFDWVKDNEIQDMPAWHEKNLIIDAYYLGETKYDFSGYNCLHISDASNIQKIRLSGTSRHPAETLMTCYGKLLNGGFEALYNNPNENIVNYEIDIITNKFSDIYVNLRPITPNKVEVIERVVTSKIYATPSDIATLEQNIQDSATDFKNWVEENKEIVREETTPVMYDHTLLNNGTYKSFGANYRHTDYYEFKAGDKIEIEYVTNAILHYLFTFDTNKQFIDGLWQETTATGGRKTRIFEPDFDGFCIVNSNFQSTLGLPKFTKIKEQLRFLTPQSGGGGSVAPRANFYFIDDYYESADAGDYGKTLNRIFSIMKSRGGVIDFGCKDYRIDTPVIVNKPAVFRGAGGMEFYSRNWLTGLFTSSPTIDMISVLGGVYFYCDKVHFYNISTLPTAGTALRLKGSTPASGSAPDKILSLVSGAIIQNCSFDGFYDNMKFDNACQFTLINPLSNYAVRYGLYVDAENWRDAGDSSIIGGNFFGTKEWLGANNRNSTAHIYHKGSGGLKINSVKFNNKADYSVLGEIAGDTVIININNCSFENHNISAIKYSKTASIFRHVNISNCEFDSYKSGTKDIDIRAGIEDINIIGNSFSSGMINTANIAINLNSVTRVRLMNTYHGYANPINAYNCNDVKEAMLQAIPQGNNV